MAHYELEVLRVENVVWNSMFSGVPSLYIKVTLGDRIWRTRIITKSLRLIWDERFLWPIADASNDVDMIVELKHKSRLGNSPCVGIVVVNLGSLIERRANDEVKLELHSPSGTSRSSELTGILFVQIKNTRSMEAMQSGLESVEQDVVRARLADANVSAGVSKVKDVSSRLEVQKDLIGSVKKVLDSVEWFKNLMNRVAGIHPCVKVVWEVASSLYEAVKGQVEADQAVVALVNSMKGIFETIRELDHLEERLKKLDETILKCINQTTECCLFIRDYTRRGFLGRMITTGARRKINEFELCFDNLKKDLISYTGLHTAFVSARISETIDVMYLRQELNPSEMDASARPQCLPGTRVGVLNEIMSWLYGETNENILWLRGVAGSGKSTIGMTIAEYCFDMRRRGAYLFFVRGKSDPGAVIRNIAFGLASFDGNIAKHITASVKDNSGVAGTSLKSQFEILLLQPLEAAADAMTGPVAIVLDALDECGARGDRFQLLKLLEEGFPKLPPSFRFIITSRPETDITSALSLPTVYPIVLDYTSTTGHNDISVYLRHEMRAIFHKSQQPLPDGWDETMTVLNKAADGLFIWASTAVKLVSDSNFPAEELEELTMYCRSHESGSRSGKGFGLNELYDTVLLNSGIQWNNSRSKERFAQALGFILLSKVPVTLATIDGMLGFPSHLILSRLTSVLAYVPGNRDALVRLFHTSFSDYLLATERKGQPWFIDFPTQRLFLATQCFDVMEKGLRFNICDLESSFVRNDDVSELKNRIKERIPSYLEYVCCFWAEHLCDLPQPEASPELLAKLTTFARRFLLYWFEVLSLTKHFRRFATRSLYDVLLWCSSNLRDTASFLWSAYRFASIFSLPISESVPHIYLSALSLGKGDFMVTDHYARGHPGIQVQRFGTKFSQPCLKVFKGHTDIVRAVTFSPDGKRIASASDDKTIRVWDAESGEVISRPFEGHTDEVLSVAFSMDGRHVASSSSDKTIRVWDAESGELVCRPFEGHTGAVTSVSWSPDGRYVASSSLDKTIRVWDAKNSEVVFEERTRGVGLVVYSSDGRRVAFGSMDCTIRVWDVLRGALVLGPLGHKDPVVSIAFSPDGKRIASSTMDSVCVWNAGSGELVLGPLDGHFHRCSSIAFSADGKRLVLCGCNDGWVCVWNIETGEPVFGPRYLDAVSVQSAMFSPDGKRIAFGVDETIHVWDANICEGVSDSFQGHTGPVLSISVSPDGKRIVSGSVDATICVWDAESGKLVLGPLRGHTDRVLSVAFAPGGKKLASGSADNSIRVWDAQSGDLVFGPFEGHTSSVTSVIFVPDGKHITSNSLDGTIRVWDVERERVVSGPVTAPSGYGFAELSQDGKRAAGRLSFRSLSSGTCICDVETGDIISGPFEGDIEKFFPDGKHIVSRSDDETIYVLNTESCKLVAGPFRGYTGRISSVVITADGMLIASEVVDGTIIVWDAQTGEIFSGPFEGHTDPIWSTVFFPNGKRVVSCSRGETIRVWDVEYGRIDSSVTTAHSIVTEAQEQSVEYPSSLHQPDSELRMTSSVPKEVGRDPSWIISNEGWLLGHKGELLAWIPDDMRGTLWQPSNTAIFNCQFSTRLDFTGCKLGEGWYEGYPREE